MSFKITSGISTITAHYAVLNEKYTKLSDLIHNTPEPQGLLNWRTYDGSSNNVTNPLWGKAHIPLRRKLLSRYEDNVSTPAVRGPNNPNPRIVSNTLCKQTVEIPNSQNLSDFTWVWGQFLDHEIDLTESNPDESANMTTPSSSDPDEEYPDRTILFKRSKTVDGLTPRQQPNEISSYIDASNVYGIDINRVFTLRSMDGFGKLRTSAADNGELIMPYNTTGLPNSAPVGTDPADFFLAGDIRANENVLLIAIHTLFVREHNRLCDKIVIEKPQWIGDDEMIFQHARRKVIGIMQNITIKEFLPALLGPSSIPLTYPGYDITINTTINNEFSTVGYRFGHSLLTSELQVGKDPNNTIGLRDGFFTPSYVKTNGADNLLLGASKRKANEIDLKIIDDVRNFLFGPPSSELLLDLASINIQRGRDHGIPGYNDLRESFNLARVTSFSEITSDTDVQTKLQTLYIDPEYIDPWIGVLAEDHLPSAAVGPLLASILKYQFERVRKGDRFWFENDPALSYNEKVEIKNTSLSDVILRNTNISSSDLSADVFHTS